MYLWNQKRQQFNVKKSILQLKVAEIEASSISSTVQSFSGGIIWLMAKMKALRCGLKLISPLQHIAWWCKVGKYSLNFGLTFSPINSLSTDCPNNGIANNSLKRKYSSIAYFWYHYHIVMFSISFKMCEIRMTLLFWTEKALKPFQALNLWWDLSL